MIIQLRALDGTIVEFENSKIIGKGEMKDVYFSPDKSYVIAFYRSEKLDKEKLIDELIRLNPDMEEDIRMYADLILTLGVEAVAPQE